MQNTRSSLTYIEATQAKWETMSKADRATVLTQAGASSQWAGSFDLYGDMPKSVSDKLVRFYILSQRVI